MKDRTRGSALPFVAMVALTALGAPELTAQEPEPAPACTAIVEPVEIEAATAAADLAVTLSEPIGVVEQFLPAGESALRIAAPEDLPRVEMAQEEGETPRPIEMAAEGNRLTLWLNTEDATPGIHEFTLVGPDGECTGTVTVTPPAG